MNEIYLAGGCFWGVEAYFSRIQGVLDTDVGYINGLCADTDYNRIAETGHAEVAKITYDPNIITLDEILQKFFGIIDPTSFNRQGNDIGTQYRTGIYSDSEEIRLIAQKSLKKLAAKYTKPIQVEVDKVHNYILAEEYHQEYLKKNPGGYCHINLDDA